MLHILNGDSTASLLKEAQLDGEILVWREALIAGPVSKDLAGEEWLNVRAKHLSEGYERPFDECLNGLRHQEEALAHIGDHDEVVLWFEHDLFCQTNLIYLLNRLSRCDTKSAKLSLICLDRFPGKPDFRGLGELSPGQIASLLPTRHEISQQEKVLGEKAWAAYCASTPKEIEELLGRDISSLPFLRGAFEKHLERFPSQHNGLGLIEHTALRLISEGISDFATLFHAFGKEEPLFGYGDLQFLNDVERLVNAHRPLVQLNSSGAREFSQSSMLQLSFKITDLGKSVLDGLADFIAENSIDFWLGGVHLTNYDHWRWNGQRMVHTKA